MRLVKLTLLQGLIEGNFNSFVFPFSTEKGIFSKTVINRIGRRWNQNDKNTFAFL